MHKKTTLKDVSKRAGVSPATVSYVLNGNTKQKISGATREKVLAAARDLNYTPNDSAKSLKSNRTHCIGVAIDKDITIPRYAQTLLGIRQVLERNRFHILFNSTKHLGGEYPDFLNSYFMRQVDGIIYIAADNKVMGVEIENTVIQYRIPLVAVDCSTANRHISTVDIDYFKGALDMAEHLYSQGVRRIAYIRPCIETVQEREREMGARRASYNHPDLEIAVHSAEFSFYGANLQLYHTASSREEREQFSDFARGVSKILNPIWRELDESSAVIFSWGGMEQFILPPVLRHGNLVKVGVLAQGLFYPGVYPELFYSYLPNQKVGTESANLVLSLIEDPDAINHLILPPELPAGFARQDNKY